MTQPERQARFERRLKWCMRGNIDSDGNLETDPKYTQYELDLNDLQKVRFCHYHSIYLT